MLKDAIHADIGKKMQESERIIHQVDIHIEKYT